MKIKNQTPFAFGLKASSRRPPQPEMTLIVRGTFNLVHGAAAAVPEGEPLLVQAPLSAEIYRPDDDARTGDILYPGDLADHKPLADLMLIGTCHVPGGRPVEACPVRFSVGGFSKVLHVVGPRTWVSRVLGDHPSDPARFTSMPVAYTHAFGGAGHAANPAGKGLGTPDLHNVTLPGEIVSGRGDRPAPAGFGPISPHWPERKGKLGTAYGAEWKKTRAPHHAEDFDPSYFNAAPADQRVPYLRGDEALSFANMHPERVLFESRLPGVRVRAFVHDTAGLFREVPLVLDTLFVDADALRLSLVWRGVDTVADAELRDVRTVLFASEPLASAPEPEAHYRARLEAFERDPIGESMPAWAGDPFAGLDMSKLAAGEQPSSAAGPQGISAAGPQGISAAGPQGISAAGPQGISAAGQQGSSAAGQGASPALDAQLDRTLATLPPGLRAAVARAVAGAGKHAAPRGLDLPARIAAALAARTPAAAPPSATSPLLDGRIRPFLAQRLAQLRKLAAGAGASGASVPGLDALEAALADPRLGQVNDAGKPGADKAGAGGAGSDTPAPGGDFRGRDWTGRDLQGVDLQGACLDGAVLTRADLRGANMAGASLRQAILAEAKLDLADLSGADLTQAQLARASARGARLTKALLDGLFAEEADFESATLDGARGEQALLMRASFVKASLAGVELEKCLFEGARLDGSVWAGARLSRCMMTQISGDGADFSDADVAHSGFSDARLRGAKLRGARGDESVWLRADLASADLRYASLRRATFSEADASRALFFGADLRHAHLDRARLDFADFERANLFGADMRRASLVRTSFRGASLYGAVLLGTATSTADFTGASLGAATRDPT